MTTDRAGQHDAGKRVGSMGWYALVGLAGGSLPLVVLGSILLQPGASSRSLPFATCVIINPLIGAGLGSLKKNADELRHGRIPEELKDEHRTFLRSLDETAGEQYKMHRFSQIAVLEEQRAEQSETLFRSNDRSAKYLKMLAAKHRRAAREPWAPVALDPRFEP